MQHRQARRASFVVLVLEYDREQVHLLAATGMSPEGRAISEVIMGHQASLS